MLPRKKANFCRAKCLETTPQILPRPKGFLFSQRKKEGSRENQRPLLPPISSKTRTDKNPGFPGGQKTRHRQQAGILLSLTCLAPPACLQEDLPASYSHGALRYQQNTGMRREPAHSCLLLLLRVSGARRLGLFGAPVLL